jgi:hypothetical protein
MRKLSLLAILAVSGFTIAGWADTLVLRDGSRYNGTLISASSRQVTFQDTAGVRRTFHANEVQAVEFQQPYAGAAYPQGSGTFSQRSQQYAGLPGAAVLPAGTQIAVRTNEAIHSSSASEGRTYSATIYQDVLDGNGNVVIPAGSPAQLVIRSVSGGGAFGSGEIALDLQSVEVNGQRYALSTANVTQKGQGGIGANKRTAEMVGGGALLGTVLGAIAGGGKGAAIGALGGAAGGTALQVLTRGRQVQVPAETVLTFRLDQPLQLQPVGY